MAEERPFTPPPRKPVSTFPTPSHVVSMYTELVNRDDPAYKANAPVKRGSIYSTMVGAKPEVISQFPLLYFLRERQFQGNDQLVFWDWINDEQAHDTYNSQDSYALESIQHPGFQREYTIRRDEYNDEPAIALGLPLNTLVAVRIVDGGGNYTQATGTITGTTVAIDFVVLDGVIISGVVTDQGEGILGTSEITVTGDGAGAIVEPIVQSTASVLVGQHKVELDPQDPLQHEFIKLVRIYQTLPGPTIYSTRTDEDGAEVTIATTAKIAATIIPREFINVSTWFKVNRQQQDNVYVANEVVESRTVKTTSSDPADDHTMISYRIDSDGMVVQVNSTLSDINAINSGETLSGAGTWVVISSQAVSDLVAKEIRETRSVPGNPVPSTRLDEDGFKVTINRTLKNLTHITSQEQISGGTQWIKTTIDPISLRLHSDEISDLVGWEVVETRLIPGDPVPSTRLDEDGIAVTISRTLKDLTTITTDETLIGTVWTKVTSEKVTELVSWQVTEVRTIPGDPVPSTKLAEDGKPVDTVRTMKSAALISTVESLGGGIWTKTTSDQITELVSWENVETRDIPGNPIASSRLDEDGGAVDITTTLKNVNAIVTAETLGGGGIWRKRTKRPISELVAEEVLEERTVPGDPVPSTRLDEDGIGVTMTRVLKSEASITPTETLVGSVWTKVTSEKVTELVSWEVTEIRAIPGNPIASTRLDKDGVEIDVVKTMKATLSITTQEQFIGTVWTKTTAEQITELVAWEVVEGRETPGNTIPSAKVGSDHETENVATILKDSTTITPGASEGGGILTTVDQREVSDLVSDEITTTKTWLDEALYSQRLPESLIPAEFRASIPTVTESHILGGTASMPALTGSQIFAQQRQLTKIFYEYRTEQFGVNLNFPIDQVGYQTTEEYGGGILSVTRRLNNSALTAEEGEDVVSSVVNQIGDNYLWIRETKRRFTDVVWPLLTEYDQDPETQSLITTTYQVVDATTVVAPSITNGVIKRFKKIDKWRSLQIIETYSLPASYEEQRFMAQTFPSLWDWTTYNYSTACGATGPIRHGFSTMVQARLAISFTTTKQTITGLTLIPNTHHLVHDIINAVLNDVGVLNYVGACSGPVDLPASSPDYTTYISTIQNTEQLISGESVLWRAGLYKNSSLYVTMR